MWKILIVTLMLAGCGGTASTPITPTAEVAPQETSSLKVTLQLDLPPVEGSQPSPFPATATRFVTDVVALDTNETLAGPVSLERVAGQSSLAQTFDGLPRGNVRLQVTALDASGSRLGLSDQQVVLDSPLEEITVSTLYLTGLTREIGRLSINQEDANGGSSQPALSSDGRIVAFTSLATNLTPDVAPPPPSIRIFRKDRASGVVTLVSGGSVDLDPDISGDGRFVVYLKDAQSVFVRDTQVARGSRAITPARLPLGPNTLNIIGARDPCISEDGNSGVYLAESLARPRQVAFFDRPTGVSTLLTATPDGRTAATCSSLSMTADARHVFFTTEGLAQGPSGLVALDRSTGLFTLVLAGGSDFPCAVSRNGVIVAVHARDHRLLLINRNTGVTAEIPRPDSFAAVGAPSLSGNGIFLTFCSGRSDLVSNDRNGQDDLFVLNRTTRVISRVNIANDQTAVRGGLLAAQGDSPVISRDGTRIAFASRDDLLVPSDDNNQLDVFSSINPTPGKLYVASGAAILRYDNITTARGPQTPAATITSPDLGPATTDIFLDVANDRLYVVTGQQSRDRVMIFEGASTLSGQVTPSRVSLTLVDTDCTGLAVDVARDELYVGRNRSSLASLLSGVGVRFFDTIVLTVILLPRQAQAIATTASGISIRDSLGGRTRPVLAGQTRALGLDLSLAALPNLLVLAEAGNGFASHSLVRYRGTLTRDSTDPFVPEQILSGAATLIGPPPPGPLGPLVVDPFTGDSYLVSGLRVLVFRATADGNVAPGRVLALNRPIQGMALDRTR